MRDARLKNGLTFDEDEEAGCLLADSAKALIHASISSMVLVLERMSANAVEWTRE